MTDNNLPPATFETLQFNSQDGLPINADYYPCDPSRGLILLCHRSHCNRGEYRETAPRLRDLGFSSLAIDQRCGMKVFGVTNETSALAKQKGLPTGYLDAQQDIEAAVDYAYALNQNQPIILLGSSYSGSLALIIATRASDKIKAVIAFSPIEELRWVRVAKAIRPLAVPTFVTGAKKEMQGITQVISLVDPQYVTLFSPQVEGFHGSKTLWQSVEGHETFWEPLGQFLAGL